MRMSISYHVVSTRRRGACDMDDDANVSGLQSGIEAEKKNGMK